MTSEGRPTWLVVAIAGAGGFLAGVLLVAILGGPKGTTHTKTKIAVHNHTDTVTRTATVTRTVDAQPDIPDVVGDNLTDAKQELENDGFDVDVQDDTLFGIVDSDNYVVTSQEPDAGTKAPPNGKVALSVARADDGG